MQNVSFSLVARAAAVSLACIVAATGCSGNGSHAGTSPHTIAAVASATKAAGAGSARGVVRGTGSASAPLESSWVTPVDPNALDNGRAAFGFLVGTRSVGNVELRWINRTLWVSRAPVPAQSAPLVGLQSVLLRRSSDRPYLPTAMSYLSAIPTAFSPARLAAWLAGAASQVSSRPGPTIGGSQTTEYFTTKPLIVIGPWPQVSVSLWADSHDRVVRVHVTSASGGTDYDVVGYTSQPAVVRPPEAQSVTPTTLAPPAASGAYAAVATGKTGATTWTVLRAPGTRDTECWRWVATPPVKIIDAKADGSRCYLAQQPDDSPSDATAFVVRSAAGGAYSALVVRMPKTPEKVTIGFAGGKLEPLTATGPLLVWVGPSTPLPGYMALTFPGGTKVECGAGPVLYADDLKTTVDAQLTAGDWACT